MSTLGLSYIESLTSGEPPVINDSVGTEIGQFCRAWVNLNGTGTIAIRDDFNVSSITDNRTGDYSVTYSNAMSNANYSVTCNGASNTDGSYQNTFVGLARSSSNIATTGCRVVCVYPVGSVGYDFEFVCVNVFSN